MTDRFSPVALTKDAWSSLRKRAVVGHERRDLSARVTIVALPVAVAGLSIWFGWSIRDAGALIAGFSLLPAALLAVVPQFASWRQRLTDRDRKNDGVARRKLDEAVSHTLLAVVVSISLAAVAVVLSNISAPAQDSPSIVMPWVARTLTGVMAGGGAYLLLTLMLVVNLLFDAYQDANALSDAAPGRPDRWREDDAA